MLSWWAETVSGLPFEFRSLSAVSTESVRAEQADMCVCVSCTNEHIVEARKLEHHSSHALKVKYKGS